MADEASFSDEEEAQQVRENVQNAMKMLSCLINRVSIYMCEVLGICRPPALVAARR